MHASAAPLLRAGALLQARRMLRSRATIVVLIAAAACASRAPTPATPAEPPAPAAAPVDPTLRAPGGQDTVVQIVTMTLKPEAEQPFVEYATAFAERVYASEPGTLTYVLTKHPTEPHTYVWFERYKDADAAKAHTSTPAMADAMAKLRGWLAKPPVIVVYPQVAPR